MKQRIEIRNDGSVYLNDGRRETAAPSIGWLIEMVQSRANNPATELQRQLELLKTNLSAACRRIADLEAGGITFSSKPALDAVDLLAQRVNVLERDVPTPSPFYVTHLAHTALEARVTLIEREQSTWKVKFGQLVVTIGRLSRLEDAFESVRAAFQSKR